MQRARPLEATRLLSRQIARYFDNTLFQIIPKSFQKRFVINAINIFLFEFKHIGRDNQKARLQTNANALECIIVLSKLIISRCQ